VAREKEPAEKPRSTSWPKKPPKPPLLDASAAALDEDHQHDHKQNSGDSTNNGGIVHFDFLSFRHQGFFCPEPAVEMSTVVAEAALFSFPKGQELALKLVEVYESPEFLRNPGLLHRSATALDKNPQHDHKQDGGNNPDERNVVHDEPLSLKSCISSGRILNPRALPRTCVHPLRAT